MTGFVDLQQLGFLHPMSGMAAGNHQLKAANLGGPPIAGDALRGQPEAVLDAAHVIAVAQADALERANIGDARLDTDRRSVASLTRMIANGIGW
jgi:hypothetical protein